MTTSQAPPPRILVVDDSLPQLKLLCLAGTVALAVHAKFRVLPHLDDANLPVMAWHIAGVTVFSVILVAAGASIRLGTRTTTTNEQGWYLFSEQKCHRVRGRVLGIVGYGRIGRAFHRKVRGLGLAEVVVVLPK